MSRLDFDRIGSSARWKLNRPTAAEASSGVIAEVLLRSMIVTSYCRVEMC